MSLSAGAAAVIGAGISTAGAIGGNMLGVAKSKRLMKIQNKLNLENWHLQNEYNLPINQMQRLKEAGLNPNLIYGSGNAVGNSSEIGKVSQGDASGPNLGSALGGALGQYVQFKQSAAQIDQTNANAELLREKAQTEATIRQLNIQRAAESVNKADWLKNDVGRIAAGIALAGKQGSYYDAQTAVAGSTAALNNQRYHFLKLANPEYLKSTQIANKIAQQSFDYNAFANPILLKRLNLANENLQAQTKLYGQEFLNKQVQNDLLKLDRDFQDQTFFERKGQVQYDTDFKKLNNSLTREKAISEWLNNSNQYYGGYGKANGIGYTYRRRQLLNSMSY